MKNKRRVCHISSSHVSRDGRIFLKQCKSLAKVGFEVYYLNRFDSFDEDGVKVEGISLTRNYGKEKNKIKLLIKAKKITDILYKKALELDCDVYQIHDPELLLCALKLKRKGKVVVFDSHENYSMQLKLSFNSVVAKIYSFVESYVLKRIDAVIFPCEKNRENIFEGKCKEAIIIGNYPMLDELYNKYNKDTEKIERSICYIGGLTYYRGIKHLMEASYAANAKLILGGRLTPPAFAKEFRAMNEYDCVVEKGFISRDETLETLQASQIGASTLLNKGQYNIYDTFATKVYEYMSLGLPVILTDSEYARRINEKYGFAILVNPENVEEITDAIKYLLNNPEIACKMGSEGRKAIKEEYNWEAEEKKLIELYNSILEK